MAEGAFLDSVFAFLIANKYPVLIASFVDEILVDIPDKIATILVSYAIFRGLPNKLTLVYKNESEIEKL